MVFPWVLTHENIPCFERHYADSMETVVAGYELRWFWLRWLECDKNMRCTNGYDRINRPSVMVYGGHDRFLGCFLKIKKVGYRFWPLKLGWKGLLEPWTKKISKEYPKCLPGAGACVVVHCHTNGFRYEALAWPFLSILPSCHWQKKSSRMR